MFIWCHELESYARITHITLLRDATPCAIRCHIIFLWVSRILEFCLDYRKSNRIK